MELQRNKIDANREVNEATFGAQPTIQVYNEYARTINQVSIDLGLIMNIYSFGLIINI